jgi:pimeloyl-ACP methyl ester carboxylesterase
MRVWFAGKCLIAGYLLLMTFGGCADKLLLVPSTDHRESAGASRKTIPLNNGVLEIWTARSAACANHQPEAYLLEFCGNGTRAEDIASYVAHRWDKHAVEVWAVNYPGFGGSTGPAKLASIAPATLAAYDSLAARAKNKPIFTGGHSFGTAASLHVAAHRNTAGLVLHTPPALRELVMGHFGWWNLWLAALPISLQIPAELDSLANAAHVNAPAVFVSALKDDWVPPRYHRMVIGAYAGPKRVIELNTGDHNSSLDAEKLAVGEAIEWLWNARAR